MPRGDTSKYTQKLKRQASRIEEEYKKRSTPRKEAVSRAWAPVNKEGGGRKKVGGAGRVALASRKAASPRGRVASAQGQSGRATSGRSAAARKPAARKSAPTRSRTSRR